MSFTQRRQIPRTIDFTCDGCPSEFLETEDYRLSDAAATAREAGWTSTQVRGEYEHYCPGCSRRLGID